MLARQDCLVAKLLFLISVLEGADTLFNLTLSKSIMIGNIFKHFIFLSFLCRFVAFTT